VLSTNEIIRAIGFLLLSDTVRENGLFFSRFFESSKNVENSKWARSKIFFGFSLAPAVPDDVTVMTLQ
jgi:hypothetical protein